MKLTKELFVVPLEQGTDRYAIYVPLKKTGVEVNSAVLRDLKELNRNPEYFGKMDEKLKTSLVNLGVIIGDDVNEDRLVPRVPRLESYMPTSVTLLPSYGCNLCCLYCYSRGGEDLTPPMTIDMSKAAVDFIVDNAVKTGQKKASLGFHGGGEPFIRGNMPLMKETVKYFKEKTKSLGLNGNIRSATNGVLSRETLDYIVNNFNGVSISIDGPKDIQDYHRPLASGGSSFDRVMESVEFFKAHKFPFGIRATVSEYSVGRLQEIVEFFDSIAPGMSPHIEPLFECGRCKTSKLHAPSPEDFLREFVKAKRSLKQSGKIYYSGGKIESLSQVFCGASGSNFFITPEGDVSTCLEVTRREDPKAGVYLIGTFNPETKKYDINDNVREFLCHRTVSNVKGCEDCFAKWHCAGDCSSKMLTETGDMMNSDGNTRCEINRGLVLDEIKQKLNDGKVVEVVK